jgi:hypothetical protein
MAESETKDDHAPANAPNAPNAPKVPKAPKAPDAKDLTDDNLDKVSGGMGVAVPQVNHASTLRGLAEPCCLSQS